MKNYGKNLDLRSQPDPRSGPVANNPIRTMDIQVTDSAPNTDLRIKFAGKHYSVPDTLWDRKAFIMSQKTWSYGPGQRQSAMP